MIDQMRLPDQFAAELRMEYELMKMRNSPAGSEQYRNWARQNIFYMGDSRFREHILQIAPPLLRVKQ